jgi:hypothetical protein
MRVEFVLTAGSLRVKFVRCGDRIGHVIERVAAGDVRELLTSREGSPDERWPASPPVQELEPAVRSPVPTTLPPEAPQVVWLIGRAGASHWSASVEAQSDDSITFDVACRLREPPDWLGSRYRLLDADVNSALAVETLEGCQLAAATDDAARGVISIAAEMPTGDLPLTVRWRYRLAWRDGRR